MSGKPYTLSQKYKTVILTAVISCAYLQGCAYISNGLLVAPTNIFEKKEGFFYMNITFFKVQGSTP